MPVPEMWVNGDELGLIVDSAAGPLYSEMLPVVALRARINDGEVIRYTYSYTDADTGETVHGAARIMVQELPHPSAKKTEERPDGPCQICGGSPHLPQPDRPDLPYHRYVAPKRTEEQPPAVDATVGEALKQLGVDPYDYLGRVPMRDSGAVPPQGYQDFLMKKYGPQE